LISESMNLVIINTETQTETNDLLNKRLFAIKNQRLGGDVEELALVIGEFHQALLANARRWEKSHVRTGKGDL
jgi:hypothetical protein